MICPHCNTNLLYRARRGRRCGACSREFALEPKETIFRMHDLRMQRSVYALSQGGKHWYTEGQLHWRLAKDRLETPVHLWSRMRGKPREKLRMPQAATSAALRNLVVDRWTQVYGAPPAGLALREQAETALQTPGDPDHVIALVACWDRDVLGCLAVNNVPTQLGIALLPLTPQGEPQPGTPDATAALAAASVPILVLHDASVSGLAQLAALRQRFGDERVRDVILTVAQARRAEKLPRTQGIPPTVDPALAPDETDRSWLGEGFEVAICAVPPGRLLSAVGRAVAATVASDPADPDRRAARAVGFV